MPHSIIFAMDRLSERALHKQPVGSRNISWAIAVTPLFQGFSISSRRIKTSNNRSRGDWLSGSCVVSAATAPSIRSWKDLSIIRLVGNITSASGNGIFASLAIRLIEREFHPCRAARFMAASTIFDCLSPDCLRRERGLLVIFRFLTL